MAILSTVFDPEFLDGLLQEIIIPDKTTPANRYNNGFMIWLD
jgi:hypothetical protein